MHTFPGTGEYDVTRSAGAARTPLHDAVSKHLMIPCARFDGTRQNRPNGGQLENKMAFHARSVTLREPASQNRGASNSNNRPVAAPGGNNGVAYSHWQRVESFPRASEPEQAPQHQLTRGEGIPSARVRCSVVGQKRRRLLYRRGEPSVST